MTTQPVMNETPLGPGSCSRMGGALVLIALLAFAWACGGHGAGGEASLDAVESSGEAQLGDASDAASPDPAVASEILSDAAEDGVDGDLPADGWLDEDGDLPAAAAWEALSWLPPGSWRAVDGPAYDDLLVVGDAGTACHYNGRYFLPVDLGLGLGAEDHLYGVDAADGLWVIVGAGGAVYRSPDRENWIALDSGVDVALRGVRIFSEESFVVVGDAGVILTWRDGGFTLEETNTENDLHAAWGVNPEELYAAGAAGGVVHAIAGGWFRQQVAGGAVTLRGIDGSDAGHMAVVGDQGAIYHSDGLVWRAELSNDMSGRDLHALRALAADSAWAAGDDGVLLEYAPTPAGDARWGLVVLDGPLNTRAAWRGLYVVEGAQGPRGVLAGAERALIANEGDGWRDASAVPARSLHDALLLPSGVVLAVGDDGLMARVYGQKVTGIPNSITEDLSGLALSPDGQALWSGGKGALHRFDLGTNIWDRLEIPSSRRVRALAGTVFAGEGGLLGRVDAEGEPRLLDAGTSTSWLAAALATSSDGTTSGDETVWVVGDSGGVLRVDGDAVEHVACPTIDAMRAVSARDGRVVIAGSNGVVLVSENDADFVAEFAEPGVVWEAAAIDAQGGVWLGGFAGRAAYRSPQGEWRDVDLPLPATIESLVLMPDGRPLALGINGLVFRFESPAGEGL